MIIYQATKTQFLQHAWRDDIEEIVTRHYRSATGRSVGPAEIQSWRHSLLEMAKVLQDGEIPADVGVAIEYQLPQTSKRIDFVITDWYMPEMTGIEFLRKLRAKDATRNVPILVVTANGSKEDVTQAVKLGVNGYVLKPFTAETLKERIDSLCAQMVTEEEEDEAEDIDEANISIG